ncbi:hypothetical protein P3X46_031919 [Hevea brasiliensis]|uniref:Nop domain-containing protein n=1 Tax=Hevea brasiliensis TaxID=3981 RepID=A0ABQ9KNU6_HEVBR|nr:hypothetical protein P3X46_031919 [Hevea brasiliensis]
MLHLRCMFKVLSKEKLISWEKEFGQSEFVRKKKANDPTPDQVKLKRSIEKENTNEVKSKSREGMMEINKNNKILEIFMRGFKMQLHKKLQSQGLELRRLIIQAIGLLDDLDKELNTYAMRVREWYGWHFPKLAKIIQDNILYAKAVKLMGSSDNAIKLDFSKILLKEIEMELKEATMISMGTEVSDVDLMNIRDLCDQVLSLSEYRAQLYDYLKSSVTTQPMGRTGTRTWASLKPPRPLVGARLIAHGGSLLNLAKQPGSTVQIPSAEKALFRALKIKHATPKYRLLFHASLVGQASLKMKGKISRSLAVKLEAWLRNPEGRELGRSTRSAKGKPKIEAYDKDRKKGAGALLSAANTYNPSVDSVLGQALSSIAGTEEEMVPRRQKTNQAEERAKEAPVTGEKKKKKKKKKTSEDKALMTNKTSSTAEPEAEESVKKEKKKRKERAENGDVQNDIENIDVGEEKKKKRKHTEQYD